MILISVAAARAIALNTDSVAYAAHSGDHAIYPDCRNEFAEALDGVLHLCHYYPVRLERPFVDMTKTDIVKLGSATRRRFFAHMVVLQRRRRPLRKMQELARSAAKRSNLRGLKTPPHTAHKKRTPQIPPSLFDFPDDDFGKARRKNLSVVVVHKAESVAVVRRA